VAEDSAAGEAPLAPAPKAPQAQPSRRPGGLIRIIRTRLRLLLVGKKRTAAVHPFLPAADIGRVEDAAA
jgi:hypothetical protein